MPPSLWKSNIDGSVNRRIKSRILRSNPAATTADTLPALDDPRVKRQFIAGDREASEESRFIPRRI